MITSRLSIAHTTAQTVIIQSYQYPITCQEYQQYIDKNRTPCYSDSRVNAESIGATLQRSF
ncbi:MAG: hypothetical protein LBK82_10115 [Planctomycetaceae bacterium]|nr:hypothetical protein [Planctomycetaceae bacterium]